MGRQRSTDRAPCAELLRRTLRSVAALHFRFSASARAAKAADLDLAAEFHRAVRAADEGRREGVRAALALPRPVCRLVDDLRHHRQARATRLSDWFSPSSEKKPRLSARSADAVGRGLSNGGRAGG